MINLSPLILYMMCRPFLLKFRPDGEKYVGTVEVGGVRGGVREGGRYKGLAYVSVYTVKVQFVICHFHWNTYQRLLS